ncbi:hypothetical protein KAR10_09360, partial [bacterium]|nr:hypothetical protein [bacterium]
DIIDAATSKLASANPVVQVNARINLDRKHALLCLAREKGTDGITGLLNMLAKAKEVEIKL